MRNLAEELKRKISDRKYAMDCLGTNEETLQAERELTQDAKLLEAARENAYAAVGVVVQDGYSLLQSSRKGFRKRVDIFLKRAIRKAIHVIFGFYIKPIFNKQTVYNGKTINAVTSLQDWCFYKQNELEELKKRLDDIDRKFEESQNGYKKLQSELEQQKDIWWHEKVRLEEANRVLEELVHERENEICALQQKREETDASASPLELSLENQILELQESQEQLVSRFEEEKQKISSINSAIKNQSSELLEVKGALDELEEQVLARVEKETRRVQNLESEWKKEQELHESKIQSLSIGIAEVEERMLVRAEQEARKIHNLDASWQNSVTECKNELLKIKQQASNVETSILTSLENCTKESENRTTLLEDKISTLQDSINELECGGIKENMAIIRHLRDKFGLHYDLCLLENAQIDYFDFENTFRGSREDIKESQRPYVEYFKINYGAEIIDLGCGRGEFLELMYDNGIRAKGIDVYAPFVAYCRERGFEVVQNDALTYLNSLPDASVGGVFMSQVLEHLEADYLVALIRCIYKKLKPGCYFIAETPNPENLSTYCNFYIDLEHMKPVHFLTMKYFLEDAGFSTIERIDNDFSKYPFELKSLGNADSAMSERQRLNEVLFSYRDYTIIAKK